MRTGLRLRSVTLLLLLTGVLLQIALPASKASADDGGRVQISELIENMAKYDGRQVTVAGEVIGDVMIRGDYAWITVNDEPYSRRSVVEGGELTGVSNTGIGVWAPRGEVQGIENLGGYDEKGDQEEVVGVFNRACPEHGGDTDIHAESVSKVGDGYPISHPFDYPRALFAAALAGLTVCLLVAWLKRRETPGWE
jgi:hypothetical protein